MRAGADQDGVEAGPVTRNPLTRTPWVPSTPIPTLPGSVCGPSLSGFWPLALMVAPRPIRVSGLVITTCSS